ncbi:MAG: Gfo/Idh/MocA family protein [Aquabacterium sp.]
MSHAPTSPIRLGIVGCGAVVREAHLPAIKAVPGVQVAMLCDRQPEIAELTAQEFDLTCPIVESVTDLIGNVDAAIVAVPPRWHAPVAMELLAGGVDVLCEKPLAVTAEVGRQMVDCAERHGRILAAALMMRFFPQNELMRRVIDEGELGDIQEVVAEDGALLDWPMATNSYFDRANTGGGVLFDYGIHTLDRLLWLFGTPSELTYEDDAYGGFEANARLSGQLQIAGATVPARLDFSWSHHLPRSIKVVGSRATAEAFISDPQNLSLTRHTRGGPLSMVVQSSVPWGRLGAYRAQLVDFIEAVRLRRQPHVSARSAIVGLEVIEAAYAVRQHMSQPWLQRKADHR